MRLFLWLIMLLRIVYPCYHNCSANIMATRALPTLTSLITSKKRLNHDHRRAYSTPPTTTLPPPHHPKLIVGSSAICTFALPYGTNFAVNTSPRHFRPPTAGAAPGTLPRYNGQGISHALTEIYSGGAPSAQIGSASLTVSQFTLLFACDCRVLGSMAMFHGEVLRKLQSRDRGGA